MTRGQPSTASRSATASRSSRRRLDAFVRGDDAQPGLVEQPRQLARRDVGQSRELDRPVAGGRDGAQRAGQVRRGQAADGVELERDLIVSHRADDRASGPMS